jgi:hypothetical protein
MMENLAAIARERAVMTTIADVIVAAAAGKSLRVAVGCADSDESAFADHLTRALHARGRPCRCLSPRPSPAAAAGSTPVHRPGSGPTITVITSGAPGPDETELCRIDIQLHTPTPAVESESPSGRPEPDAYAGRSAGDDHEPDIVVDYHESVGPAIRHIVPTLSPPLLDQQ